MFDVFPIFAAALRPVFVNFVYQRGPDKRSSFLYPKYSHTTNLDLYLDVG